MKFSAVLIEDCIFIGIWFKIIATDDNGKKKKYIDIFNNKGQAERLAFEFESAEIEILTRNWETVNDVANNSSTTAF